jgi:hypothetical protein
VVCNRPWRDKRESGAVNIKYPCNLIDTIR